MTNTTEQERRRAVNQTLASWAIEGFEPDAKYLALVERYVSGELSLDDLHRYHDEAAAPFSSAA